MCRRGLKSWDFGRSSFGCEFPIDFFNRKGLRIEVVSNPVAHFFVLFMVRVSEGVEKIIKPGDATAVVGRTCEFPIDADWIVHIGKERQLLLEDHCVSQLSPKS